MPINKPLLPPKSGYVEVIDENGEHVYEPTPETLRAQQEQAKRDAEIDAKIAAIYDEMAAAYQEGVEQA